MSAGVPVVAYGAGAVPETLGAAGILLEDKEPFHVAGVLDQMRQDPVLRASVLLSQERRLRDFEGDGRLLMLERLSPVIAHGAP
jgi:hypothetical protein